MTDRISIVSPWEAAPTDGGTLVLVGSEGVAAAAAELEGTQLNAAIVVEIRRLMFVFLQLPEELRDRLMVSTNDVLELRSRLAALRAFNGEGVDA